VLDAGSDVVVFAPVLSPVPSLASLAAAESEPPLESPLASGALASDSEDGFSRLSVR
jgi:hypothetical protein